MDISSVIAKLNIKENRYSRSYDPVEYESNYEKLDGIKAVLFDVYGTLIDYNREELSDKDEKQKYIKECFKKLIEKFNLEKVLLKMDPDKDSSVTLRDLYHGLIYISHQRSAKNGIEYPEIKIEDIWETLILMFKRNGYNIPSMWNDSKELAYAMAYYYHYNVLGRRLYPGVFEYLKELKKTGRLIGIISNAQFYTMYDLSYLFTKQNNGKQFFAEDLFSEDFSFLSYKLGYSKPNPKIFEKAVDRLNDVDIKPEETLYVGNDIYNDIYGASKHGMRTALFVGDKQSIKISKEHDIDIKPDLVIEQLLDLLMKI